MTDAISYRPILWQQGFSNGSSYQTFAANGFQGEASLGDFSGTNSFTVSAGATYTQIYTFEVNNDSERGLQLDTPNFFTQASQSQYFTLTINTKLTSPRSDIGLQYQTGPTPSAWEVSGPNLPENVTDFQDIENPIASDSSLWVLNGSTYDLVIPLDFNTQYGTGSTESIKRTVNKPTWNGRLSLAFPNSGASWAFTINSDTFDRGLMVGQYVPFHTGWDGAPASRGRPVRDMRTGLPAFAEDLIEDGFHPGIWTSARSWDPTDPRDLRPVEFPAGEGTKKDDVPV